MARFYYIMAGYKMNLYIWTVIFPNYFGFGQHLQVKYKSEQSVNLEFKLGNINKLKNTIEHRITNLNKVNNSKIIL